MLSAAPPIPTVVSVMGDSLAVAESAYAGGMDTGTDTAGDTSADGGTAGDGTAAGIDAAWTPLPRGLLRLRRFVLAATVPVLTAGLGALLWFTAGPVWALFAVPPTLLGGWGWWLLERNWRSWRYAERADDLLISRGVLWRELTVVPYGRMQLVEVTSGPLERHFGLASVQLHTAAAASDARIPGLLPSEAARLRDRLTELGQARSAGL